MSDDPCIRCDGTGVNRGRKCGRCGGDGRDFDLVESIQEDREAKPRWRLWRFRWFWRRQDDGSILVCGWRR